MANAWDDQPHARHTDPATSFEAATSIHITAQAARILKSYLNGRELLDVEAYSQAGFGPNARDGQRCSDLRHAGFIERTGARRSTPSGKRGYVCRITVAGLIWLGAAAVS